MPLRNNELRYEITADDESGPALESFERNVREAARVAEREFDDVGDAAERAERDIDDLGEGGSGSLGKLAGAFALVGGAGALGDFIFSAQEAAIEVGQLNDQTGLQVETLSALMNAAEQSGVEFDSLISAFRTMQDRLVDATRGGGDATESLEALGLSINVLTALDPEGQFTAIADAIAAVEDPTERAGAASILLGDDYLALLSVMSDVEGGFEDVIERMREQGNLIDEDAVRQAEEFRAQWEQTKQTLEGLALTTFPVLGASLEALNALLTDPVDLLRAIGEGAGFLLGITDEPPASIPELGPGLRAGPFGPEPAGDVRLGEPFGPPSFDPSRSSGRTPGGGRIGRSEFEGPYPGDDRFYEQPYDPRLGFNPARPSRTVPAPPNVQPDASLVFSVPGLTEAIDRLSESVAGTDAYRRYLQDRAEDQGDQP